MCLIFSDNLLKVIASNNLLSFYCVPYYLKLLVQVVRGYGAVDGKKQIIPNDLCYLFDRFVTSAIISEIRGTNSSFADDDLIDKELQSDIIKRDGLLPNKDMCYESIFFKTLSLIAFSKINYVCRIGDYSSGITYDKKEKKVIKVAKSIGFMEERGGESVFRHSLLQSFFAGLYFYCEYLKNDDILNSVSSESINAWKDVLLFVARLIRDKKKLKGYVEYLRTIDKLFACEVVAQEQDAIDEEYVDFFKELVAKISQEDTDILKRIRAGMISGRLGDKRFNVNRSESNNALYIIPPFSKISTGKYYVHYDERKKTNGDYIEIDELFVGKYLVTNYEYSKSLFVNNFMLRQNSFQKQLGSL